MLNEQTKAIEGCPHASPSLNNLPILKIIIIVHEILRTVYRRTYILF